MLKRPISGPVAEAINAFVGMGAAKTQTATQVVPTAQALSGVQTSAQVLASVPAASAGAELNFDFQEDLFCVTTQAGSSNTVADVTVEGMSATSFSPAPAPAAPPQATSTPTSVSTSTSVTSSAPAINTLHYGGSISPKTKALGAKPAPTNAFRTQRRFETIVRCENAGIPERAIASMLVISVPRLRTIKKTPEYLAARMKITHGIVIDHDASLAQIRDQRKEMLTQMLPPALAVLANALTEPALTVAEKKYRLSAAQDVLDREGTYAKVSRTEVKPVSFFDFEHSDQSSDDIIRAIKGVTTAPQAGAVSQAHVTNIINLSQAFSNSDTLSAIDQQKALEDLDSTMLLDAEPSFMDQATQ